MRDELERLRLQRQLKDRGPWITDYDQACAYVEKMGVVMPWTTAGYPLPSLREIYSGEVTREPGPVWDWKDRMPVEKKAFYGALLRKGKVLLAPRLVPAFYCASGRVGDPEEYQVDYEDGTLSYLAKQTMDALQAGPLRSRDLRKKLKLIGCDTKGLEKDLDELQNRFYVTKLDVDANGGYVWGLVDQGWHDVPRRAAELTRPMARAEVALSLLSAAFCLTAKELEKMIGWTETITNSTLGMLVSQGKARPSEDEDGLFSLA
jgi:hypothetical protein